MHSKNLKDTATKNEVTSTLHEYSDIVSIIKKSVKTTENGMVCIKILPFDWARLSVFIERRTENNQDESLNLIDIVNKNKQLQEENEKLKAFFMETARSIRSTLTFRWDEFEREFQNNLSK